MLHFVGSGELNSDHLTNTFTAVLSPTAFELYILAPDLMFNLSNNLKSYISLYCTDEKIRHSGRLSSCPTQSTKE